MQAAEEDIDRAERNIEALCMRLLLRQQPVATDLRNISAALKMISDLERVGDYAVDIAGFRPIWQRHSSQAKCICLKWRWLLWIW